MNISSNISSIQAHQTMMNTNANNIANVNTDGSVTANTTKADNTSSLMSQTDLVKEIPDQMIAEKATAVNATAIRTQDEMLGSLLDIKS